MEQMNRHQHAFGTRQAPHGKPDPTNDLSFRIAQAEKAGNYTTWAHVFARVWSNWNAPAQQLYELVQRCPASFPDRSTDLRMELLGHYRDELLSTLSSENITSKIRKFMTLLQLANFIGRAAYLKERALIIIAFHEAKVPLPRELKERIASCEKWNKKAGHYSETELLGAGYELKKEDAHQKIFVHPLSHESLTVYTKDSLSEGDRAKLRATRDSQKEARRQARSRNPNKGTSAPKEQKGGKKKK